MSKQPKSFFTGTRTLLSLILGGLLVLAATIALGQSDAANTGRRVETGAERDGLPKLHTNQNYIEDVSRRPTLDIHDPMSVFSFILSKLPDEARVYPTENYYYFNFYFRGVRFAGNLRLAADARDGGNIHVTYFRDYTGWVSEEAGQSRMLNGKDGVNVEKTGKLAYRVSYMGLSVLFRLNDLSDIAPPKNMIRGSETYIGPVFDESGIQFFLVYNSRNRMFHYILNETAHLPERLFASGVSDRIVIGNRTGFAFYRDRYSDRKILVGVYNGNANVNNYFDGPFDQLPDNFLKDDTLKNAILEVSPDLKGQIDRYGNSPGKQNRYMIAPYKHYWLESELLVFEDCATKTTARDEDYYACFLARDEQ